MKARSPVTFLRTAVVRRGRWLWEPAPRPKWRQVQLAVERLDGRVRPLIRLDTLDPFVTLEIMRSVETEDRFLVTHQQAAGKGVVLAWLDWTEPPSSYTFRWNERTYTWPARCAVPRLLAETAARAFLETGVAATGLYWEMVSDEIMERTAVHKAP